MILKRLICQVLHFTDLTRTLQISGGEVHFLIRRVLGCFDLFESAYNQNVDGVFSFIISRSLRRTFSEVLVPLE